MIGVSILLRSWTRISRRKKAAQGSCKLGQMWLATAAGLTILPRIEPQFGGVCLDMARPFSKTTMLAANDNVEDPAKSVIYHYRSAIL